jgi:hypothetical protein
VGRAYPAYPGDFTLPNTSTYGEHKPKLRVDSLTLSDTAYALGATATGKKVVEARTTFGTTGSVVVALAGTLGTITSAVASLGENLASTKAFVTAAFSGSDLTLKCFALNGTLTTTAGTVNYVAMGTES